MFIRLVKKIFAISLACIVILSGMNLTFATHYCSGEYAGSRISITGKKASCGMRSDKESRPVFGTHLSRHCCEDKISLYSVDNNYSPSEFHFNRIVVPQVILCFISEASLLPSGIFSSSIHTNISPPDDYRTNAVCMAEICVFRI